MDFSSALQKIEVGNLPVEQHSDTSESNKDTYQELSSTDSILSLPPVLEPFVSTNSLTSANTPQFTCSQDNLQDALRTPLSRRGRLPKAESLARLRSNSSPDIIDYFGRGKDGHAKRKRNSPEGKSPRSGKFRTVQLTSRASSSAVEAATYNMAQSGQQFALFSFEGANDMSSLIQKLTESFQAIQMQVASSGAGIRAEMSTSKQDLIKTLTEETGKISEEVKRIEHKWDADKKILENRLEKVESALNNLNANARPQGDDVVFGTPTSSASKVLNHYITQLDRQEKDRKKLNIIIRGLNPSAGSELLLTNNFLSTKFNMTNVATSAKILGRDNKAILVGLPNVESKSEILKRKGLLKGSNIFVDRDQTWLEREAQMRIRDAARKAKSEGKSTKVGFNWVEIAGVRFMWSYEQMTLKLSTLPPRNQPASLPPPAGFQPLPAWNAANQYAFPTAVPTAAQSNAPKNF